MFSHNIFNINNLTPGIDGMFLAIPEIFIFCSTLILMVLDIFFFKEKRYYSPFIWSLEKSWKNL